MYCPKSSCATSLSEYKLLLQQIIRNIRKLEHLEECNKSEELFDHNEAKNLMNETDLLLTQAEKVPAKKILNISQKRKNRRIAAKKKRITIPVNKAEQKIKHSCVTPREAVPTNEIARLDASADKKPHIRLRAHHDAQYFLRTFQLLKKLHFLRCRNKDKTKQFASNFEDLEILWHKVLAENDPQHGNENPIEDQWDEVLFGSTEQAYCKTSRQFANFLRIRRAWDLYICNGEQGTPIPPGWVIPPEHAAERWKKYRADSS